MSGHTPGPWTAHPAEEQEDGSVLYWYVNQGGGHYDPAVVSTWQNHEANARLIAAAPELLAALVRLMPTNIDLENPNVSRLETVPCDVSVDELRQAKAAIAKATQ